jgi:hypothetical protein
LPEAAFLEARGGGFVLDMDDPLVVYLHDHLAGSSFAVELLEKLASEFDGTSSGEVARELLEQIQTDRKTLEQLIAKVGKANKDIYDALGWIAERVSRIKLKHDDPTGFGAFEAFETINLGILGKRSLWETLRIRQNADNRVAGLDYDVLIGRAEQQFQKANQYRLELIQDALSKQESGS